MPTLLQVRNACDTVIETVQNRVTARQANYFINKARYWQGLSTHSVLPSHTTAKWDNLPPDRLLDNPHDQFENWIATIPDMDTVTIPCAFQIHVYDGPVGKGYEVIASCKYNDVLYERHMNIGPETWRTSPWAAVEA